MKPYLDTGTFVTPILRNREASVIAACQAWLERVSRGDVEVLTSSLTWVEVVHVLGRTPKPYDPVRAAEAGRIFLELPHVERVAVDDSVLTQAQRLAGGGSRSSDLVHLATAILRGANPFVTLDAGLAARGRQVGLIVDYLG